MVRFITLSKTNHALLAGVEGALEDKGVAWNNAVLVEVLSLQLSLWEVFKKDARADLL